MMSSGEEFGEFIPVRVGSVEPYREPAAVAMVR